MCHNSLLENEQIEKCIENGMPTKVINTIKYTMRKRIADKDNNDKPQQITENQNDQQTQQINEQKPPQGYVSKCPFGFSKFATSEPTFSFASLTPTTTIDNEFEFTNNNNNNLYEQFPQISRLSNRITTTENDDNKKLLLPTKEIYYNDDILAKSTQVTREFAYIMQQAIRRLKCNKIYTLLTKTTQPAHLIAIGIVTFVLVAIWPEFVDDNNNGSVPRPETSTSKIYKLALIAYLGAFATHFGAQIWMTFVSGLSLYFSLPRHIFGQCQQVLFPKYFAINAMLSITMLVLYVKFFFTTWTVAKCIQLGSLALTSAIELLVRLYLAPPLLRLMHEKYKIEGAIGSGNEIGSLVQGDLINCPHYQRIHKAFRRLHMTAAIGNMITMAGSCLQLYNIAGQLQISIV